MAKIWEGLEDVFIHMDDILVFARNEEEHEAQLEATLKRIEKAGITLNSEKCKFHQNQLKFLGHVIDKDGVHADPEKVKSVIDMKAPTNVLESHRFMGMVNQLAKFTPNLAEITQPLRELLSKKNTYLWSPDQEKSFEKIKQKLSKPTYLPYLTQPQIQRYQLMPHLWSRSCTITETWTGLETNCIRLSYNDRNRKKISSN